MHVLTIVQDNIEKLIDRDSQIEELLDKTSDLDIDTNRFLVETKKVESHMRQKNRKICCVVIIVCAVVVVLGIIVLAIMLTRRGGRGETFYFLHFASLLMKNLPGGSCFRMDTVIVINKREYKFRDLKQKNGELSITFFFLIDLGTNFFQIVSFLTLLRNMIWQ